MPELNKELGLYGLTMVSVGSSIGAGIFLTPTQIAGHLQSPLLILLVWGLGGVITLTGALTFAELGACLSQPQFLSPHSELQCFCLIYSQNLFRDNERRPVFQEYIQGSSSFSNACQC
jgi:APA family basic amino acid/polyamine antiporter